MPDSAIEAPAIPAVEPIRRRRRSQYVSTLLIGAAALNLAACGDDPPQQAEAKIFPTIEACRAEFPEDQCKQAFEASRQLHLQTAPRFASQGDCEAQAGAGACQPMPMFQPDGSVTNMFVPALMGFMLARALQPQQGYGLGPGFSYGGGYYHPRPIFIDRDGFMRSGRDEIGRYQGGRDAFARSRVPTTVQTPVSRSGQIGKPAAKRGGFGQTSSRFSGGGS